MESERSHTHHITGHAGVLGCRFKLSILPSIGLARVGIPFRWMRMFIQWRSILSQEDRCNGSSNSGCKLLLMLMFGRFLFDFSRTVTAATFAFVFAWVFVCRFVVANTNNGIHCHPQTKIKCFDCTQSRTIDDVRWIVYFFFYFSKFDFIQGDEIRGTFCLRL